jgi:phenylacetate-CoA ligase
MGPGAPGRFVCTGLLNLDMPLVRYEIGDRGQPLVWDHDCACGRRLPILPGVDGRIDDVVLTADGREVGRLDPVFKGGLPVREAQIVQEALTRIRVNVVPGDGFDRRAEDELVRRVRDRLGDVHVAVERLAELPRTRAGKMQAVVSMIKPGSAA